MTAEVLSTRVDGIHPPPDIPPSDDPEAALAAVVALRRLADGLERAAIGHALAQGWTWARIAQALGVTRQAAHKRHGRTAPARRPTEEES